MRGVMSDSRQEIVERLLAGYRRFYNITRFDGGPNPHPEEWKGLREGDKVPPLSFPGNGNLVAVCEYYERGQQYFLFRTNELWSSQQEEFIFLFSVGTLTKEVFEACRDFAREEGMKLAHIGPGHMYTYITPVFVCDTAEEAAIALLEKCRIYKSFLFSFHGWMDFHIACFETGKNKLYFNRSGRCMEKNMKKVLLTVREELS